jgi:hypothetical protein
VYWIRYIGFCVLDCEWRDALSQHSAYQNDLTLCRIQTARSSRSTFQLLDPSIPRPIFPARSLPAARSFPILTARSRTGAGLLPFGCCSILTGIPL